MIEEVFHDAVDEVCRRTEALRFDHQLTFDPVADITPLQWAVMDIWRQWGIHAEPCISLLGLWDGVRFVFHFPSGHRNARGRWVIVPAVALIGRGEDYDPAWVARVWMAYCMAHVAQYRFSGDEP